MGKEFYTLIPENLNLQQLITENPPEEELNVDFLRYVICRIVRKNSHVYRQIQQNEGETGEMNYTYVPMNSEVLKEVRYDYKRHMEWLLKARICTRQSYIVGERSFGYKLTEKYQFKQLKLEAIKCSKIRRNIRKFHKKITKSKRKKFDKFTFLIDKFNKHKFNVDFDSLFSELHKEQSYVHNYSSYLSSVVTAIELHNTLITINHNPITDGRVHTTITQTPRSIRRFLSVGNGIKLGEVDLSNSIPFFLYIYLLHTYIINNSSTIFTPYILKKIDVTLCPQELQRFGELTIKGGLYELFMDDFEGLGFEKLKSLHYGLVDKKRGSKFEGTDKQIRKIVKKSLLGMIFGKGSQFRQMRDFFKVEFPTIYTWLIRIKRFGKGKDRYKKVSHCLFQMEAHYMIKIAFTFNTKERGRTPLFTLHDCLITTINKLDELETHMRNEFIRMLGVSPNLKRKEWIEKEVSLNPSTRPDDACNVVVLKTKKVA